MTLVRNWLRRTAVGSHRQLIACTCLLSVIVLLLGTFVSAALAKTKHKHAGSAAQSVSSSHSAKDSSSKSKKHGTAEAAPVTSSRRHHRNEPVAPVTSSRMRHGTVTAVPGPTGHRRHGSAPVEAVVSSRRRGKHGRLPSREPVIADSHKHRSHGQKHGSHATTASTHSTGGSEPDTNPVPIKQVPVATEPVGEPFDYQNQAKIYSLYDQGLNARLAGDNQTALSRLAQLTEILKDSRLSPTMQSMAEYELGRAAERDGQLSLATDAYERSLKLNPRYTDASVRLSGVLLRTGHPAQALMQAKNAVQKSPNDPEARMALSLVLEKNGLASDAKIEREKAVQLISGIGKVAEPSQPLDRQPEPEGEMIKSPEQEPGGVSQKGAPVPEGDLLTPGSEPGNVP